MFKRVLIANRGEIAVRIARACRDLGISTVGVYSEADRYAPFLDWMDDAYLIGPAAPAQSYLNIAAIVEVALRSGAEAIHPGYGFLAENPELARAAEAAGLVFVGPSADAIEAMGDKAVARRAAADAGVPLVPGTPPVTSANEVRSFAREHGFPVAIKAVAGGGGRGLRVVASEDGIEAALETARREGQMYFGNPQVYLERYLHNPKHIEIQVMADRSGRAVSFGERDCSVQRRHQKLIEEAPGPTVTDATRARMEAAALSLVERVGYLGAGTLEFLMEPGGDFYFLEMNTRIQVEHPVTELVRGRDLVASQILIAAGESVAEPLPIRGHAIECRVNAEDVVQDFRPAAGTMRRLREPAGPGVRVDSAVREGYTIPADYDSMIAKLVVWGSDREQARGRMLRALGEFQIDGVPTTIPAHAWILQQPEYISGEFGTTFLARHAESLRAAIRKAEPEPTENLAPDTAAQSVLVEVNGRRFQVVVHGLSGPERESVRAKPPVTSGGGLGRATGGRLLSPIQGSVLRVNVAEGETVSQGDVICVVEAMKMENEVLAQRPGTVSRLHVTAGQSVAVGAPIADITD